LNTFKAGGLFFTIFYNIYIQFQSCLLAVQDSLEERKIYLNQEQSKKIKINQYQKRKPTYL